MSRAIRILQHYASAFGDAVKVNGWSFALRRAAGFVGGRIVSRLRRKLRIKAREPVNPFRDIIGRLTTIPAARPLLLIVSDIQIGFVA